MLLFVLLVCWKCSIRVKSHCINLTGYNLNPTLIYTKPGTHIIKVSLEFILVTWTSTRGNKEKKKFNPLRHNFINYREWTVFFIILPPHNNYHFSISFLFTQEINQRHPAARKDGKISFYLQPSIRTTNIPTVYLLFYKYLWLLLNTWIIVKFYHYIFSLRSLILIIISISI